MRVLMMIDEYIKNNDYNGLLLFLNKNKRLNYSFVEYILFIIDKTNNKQLDIVLNKFMDYDGLDNKNDMEDDLNF
jgi:hypothetical protein